MMTKNLIKRHLILECAMKKRFTTYGELITNLGLPYDLAKAQDRKSFGEVLGEISTEENENGMPLLSSLVLDSTKLLPGDGFFGMCENIGKPVNADTPRDEKILFAHKEQMKCFKFWKQKREYTLIEEIERRQQMIISEPNGIVRETMIANLLLDL